MILIKNNTYWSGVRHIHSPSSVTKDILLAIINDRYNLNITINNTTAGTACDRTLDSKHLADHEVLELYNQVDEMYLYKDTLLS